MELFEEIDSDKEHPVPKVAIQTTVHIGGMDIKTYVLSSYLRFRSGSTQVAYRWQAPDENDLIEITYTLSNILNHFSTTQEGRFNGKYVHEEGVAFLYAYTSGSPKKVSIGVDLELIRKSATWNENPMVDSWTFETTVKDWAANAKAFPREQGIMCMAETVLLGRELELKLASRNRNEFLSKFPELPASLRAQTLLQDSKVHFSRARVS